LVEHKEDPSINATRRTEAAKELQKCPSLHTAEHKLENGLEDSSMLDDFTFARKIPADLAKANKANLRQHMIS
jgi:hypothetical protein